ncbi:unnamed protein product [Acanthoscelides obtectus]|uniref:C2H2-type domain-containing protein n=1 Tax=Acanthoscelides obtectus TaxID=200917 RepID=A0A9P0NV96_ACAOB|nr:unnamed protein product [Acanthoscelides obtectus]CAK1639633.1 Zinc finger protein 90 [Acanthoscelides obtectus]
MPRRHLHPEVASNQNSCSLCLKYEHQCKDQKLLDITEIVDGDKSCLDKIQELMHVEIVLGYQTICVTCESEINEAYQLRGKILDAIAFWKKHFGYEEASESNTSTDAQTCIAPTQKVECDDSVTTIPRTEKIEVEEESDDNVTAVESYQDDFDSDDEPLHCKKARLLKDSNSNETSPDMKFKIKKDPDTKKEPKSEIADDVLDLTDGTITLISEASIKRIPGATIKKISDVKKEEEKENTDSKKLNLFCGRCTYYYADLSEITTHICVEIPTSNQKKKQQPTKSQPSRREPKPIACFGCAACGKVFKRKIDLNRHKKEEHAVEKPRQVCNICDKSFKNATLLREHYSVHTGEQNYCCDVCGKTFQRLSSRSRHMRKHTTDERSRKTPFLCTICGKLFPYSNTMSRHMMSHAGVKRFTCKICNKKFNQMAHLR